MDKSTIHRTAMHIKRTPITILSEKGYNYGGWMHFPKPEGERPPSFGKLQPNEKVLFCPYCGEWTIFRRTRDDLSLYKCTGWCGWGNTNDYYTKKVNNLWSVNTKAFVSRRTTKRKK